LKNAYETIPDRADFRNRGGWAAGASRNKRFPAVGQMVAERAGLVRVLVGPFKADALNGMKQDLTDAGFRGLQAIRRTFEGVPPGDGTRLAPKVSPH
jgi:hypothetical protein